MCKPTYTVKEYIKTHEFTRHINTMIVTFMLFAVTSVGTASQVNFRADGMTQSTVVKEVSGHSVTLNRVMPMTKTMQMADAAFDKLTARMPEAKEAEPVKHFITEGIGNVDAAGMTLRQLLHQDVLAAELAVGLVAVESRAGHGKGPVAEHVLGVVLREHRVHFR